MSASPASDNVRPHLFAIVGGRLIAA